MGSKILLVDDEEIVQSAISRHLAKLGLTVRKALSLEQARGVIAAEIFDAVLLDVVLPDGISLDLIKDLNTSEEGTPVIVMSGAADIPTAVKAMKLGAFNFITKPIDMEELGISIQKNLELLEIRKQGYRTKRLSSNNLRAHFGTSTKSSLVQTHAEFAFNSDSVVLLLGETGTGKGVLARWIHENSSRKNGNFVELNCPSLRGELLRSELYGHVRGSFTSALKDREGLIEIADRGTLFLDEIGDMDLSVQAELLKTIEEKTFRRIGENKVRTSSFRLICATNMNLRERSEQGKFRSDLYYRICVFPLELPALRETKEDILGFLKHFLAGSGYEKFPLKASLLKALIEYRWPGNIREMRNMVERALLLAQGEELGIKHFPGIATRARPEEAECDDWSLAELERRHICRAIEHFGNDLSKASEALGISEELLNRKMESLSALAF